MKHRRTLQEINNKAAELGLTCDSKKALLDKIYKLLENEDVYAAISLLTMNGYDSIDDLESEVENN